MPAPKKMTLFAKIKWQIPSFLNKQAYYINQTASHERENPLPFPPTARISHRLFLQMPSGPN